MSGGPTLAIVERAADWQARLGADDASTEDHADCLAWRQAHPDHELAWARVQTLWQRFERMPAAPARAALDAARRVPATSRRRGLQVGVAGLLLLGAVSLGSLSPAGRSVLADHRSGAMPQTVALADGSQLTLDAHSAVDVSLFAHERRVALRRGQVLVDVAADAARPFVVTTPQGSAQALGTRYLVRRIGERTRVTVLESRVRACAAHADCTDLAAGEQAELLVGYTPVKERADVTAQAAWTRGQLALDDVPLPAVLAQLAPHRRGLLRYDAAALRSLRVSGVLPLHDTDRALEVLQATLPIEIERRSDWWTTVRRKKDS